MGSLGGFAELSEVSWEDLWPSIGAYVGGFVFVMARFPFFGHTAMPPVGLDFFWGPLWASGGPWATPGVGPVNLPTQCMRNVVFNIVALNLDLPR